MDKIFSKRLTGKSDASLFEVVQNHQKYVEEAVLSAIEILEQRGSLRTGRFSQAEIESVVKIKSEIQFKLDDKKETYKQSIIEQVNRPDFWGWLPKSHLLDLLGYYSMVLIVGIAINLPDLRDSINIFWFLGLAFIVPLWQGNIMAKNDEIKRSIHFHERLIFSVFAIALFLFRIHWVNDNLVLEEIIMIPFIYILFLIASGIFSFFFFFIRIRPLAKEKWYFIHRLRFFAPIYVVILLLLIVIKEGWFVPKDQIVWDENRPLAVGDFNGNVDLFTHYDGVISSGIFMEFDEDDRISKLEGRMNTHRSWINPWDRDSYFLLQHEQFHFNITELFARKARKAVVEALESGAGRSQIEEIVREKRKELSAFQDLYDDETNHSAKKDQQGYWQFKIDSMLLEYDSYWSNTVLEPSEVVDSIKHFRFVRWEGGMLKGYGQLLPGEYKYTQHYRFHYSNVGVIDSVQFFQYGERALDSYLNAHLVKFKRDDQRLDLEMYDESNNPVAIEGSVYKYNIAEYSDHREIAFFDQYGHRTNRQNTDVFKEHYLFDSLGRFSQKRYYNDVGEMVRDEEGWMLVMYEYNSDNPYFTVKSNYNEEGKPLTTKEGFTRLVYLKDSIGNSLSELKLDKNGVKVQSSGFAEKRREFDHLGRYVELTFYDSNGHMCEVNDLNSTLQWSYDRFGNIARTTTLNANGVKVNNQDGYATQIVRYDHKGNVRLTARYGTGNELVFDEEGIGKELLAFDDKDRVVKYQNFNAYDYPIYPQHTVEYDSSKGSMKIEYLDSKGSVKENKYGVAYSILVLDDRDNLIKQSYFDKNSQLVAVEKDVARFDFFYDSLDNKIESRFYDVFENLAQGNQGVSINRYQYDGNLLIERSYFDSLDHLTLFDGSAKINWRYDERGNEIEAKYYGVNNDLLDSTIAIVRQVYDQKDNLIEVRKYDKYDSLIRTEPSIIRYRYNDWNEQVEAKFYDYQDQAMVDSLGVHCYVYHYFENSFFGEEYLNLVGELTEVNGIAQIQLDLDQRANVIKKQFFNKNRELTTDESGVAIYVFEHDLYDRVVKESYFGSNELICQNSDGIAEKILVRDNAGHIIEERYYDENYQLCENKDGIALRNIYFDRNGGHKETTYSLIDAKDRLEIK